MTGYKTIITAIAVALLGFLEQFDVTALVPENYDGLALAGVGFLMAALRWVTKTPLFKDE